MSRRECECDHIRGAVKAALGDNNLRCAACLDAILESKNELVRENALLREKLGLPAVGGLAGAGVGVPGEGVT